VTPWRTIPTLTYNEEEPHKRKIGSSSFDFGINEYALEKSNKVGDQPCTLSLRLTIKDRVEWTSIIYGLV
jgi:hypothetical protein